MPAVRECGLCVGAAVSHRTMVGLELGLRVTLEGGGGDGVSVGVNANWVAGVDLVLEIVLEHVRMRAFATSNFRDSCQVFHFSIGNKIFLGLIAQIVN